MNWDDLRFVLAASRTRTLVAAAEQLGVTHTTVGRRLRACEERLGVRLFDRTPEGLHVTPAGQDLLDVAERVEGDVLAAQSRLMGRDADLRGQLRVSILDYLFPDLAPAFRSFVQRFPHVELTVNTSADPVSLVRREADIAMRLSQDPPGSLLGRRIGEVPFAVYGSEDLIARIGADAPLGAFPWIGWDVHLQAGWFDEWLKENAPGARIVVRIDESAIVRREAIAAGLGLFFLPCFEGDRLDGVRRMGPVHFQRSLWLLTLAELRHTSRVRAFIEHMVPRCTALTSRNRPA